LRKGDIHMTSFSARAERLVTGHRRGLLPGNVSLPDSSAVSPRARPGPGGWRLERPLGSAVSSSNGMLVAVTDHAAERFRQRVRGTLDAKTEIASRVARAHAAGRVEQDARGSVLVGDLERRDLVYVCRPEGSELVVVTLWEEGEGAAVPKRFTDALRRDDHRVA